MVKSELELSYEFARLLMYHVTRAGIDRTWHEIVGKAKRSRESSRDCRACVRSDTRGVTATDDGHTTLWPGVEEAKSVDDAIFTAARRSAKDPVWVPMAVGVR